MKFYAFMLFLNIWYAWVFRVTLEGQWCWRLRVTGYRSVLYPLVTSVVNQDILESTRGSQSILTGYVRTWSSSRRQAVEDIATSAEWWKCLFWPGFVTSHLPVSAYCRSVLLLTGQLTFKWCWFLNASCYTGQQNFTFKLFENVYVCYCTQRLALRG